MRAISIYKLGKDLKNNLAIINTVFVIIIIAQLVVPARLCLNAPWFGSVALCYYLTPQTTSLIKVVLSCQNKVVPTYKLK